MIAKNIMYVFHPRLEINVGVIITIKKLYVQFELTATALPFWRAWRGRSSPVKTQGTTLLVAEKAKRY